MKSPSGAAYNTCQQQIIARSRHLFEHPCPPRKEHPHALTEGGRRRHRSTRRRCCLRVVGVGYSRGAVLVPGFARLVDEFGIAHPEGLKFGRDAHGNLTVESSQILVPPGEVAQAVGLFDPVGTNLPKNYDARLPKSVLSGFSQIARDEQRELFLHQTILDPDWSDDGRFLSATLPGGHSNIGGGNDEAGLETLAFNGMADYLNALTDRPLFTHRVVPSDPAQFTIFQATGATAAFGLRMDKDGQRNLRDELANCKIVDICRDADPVDQALANRFNWQRVTPQLTESLPRLPDPISITPPAEAPPWSLPPVPMASAASTASTASTALN
ncbi:DUF2235 domain-containing protein [Luteibacter yeojuensis]|uniref:DUF2235 domain-containing protein n=1 Tax=Luteibacter yeojuensis TaxID=345309 RepID=A0A7X5QU46_9GAMM|nr:DUF2235 domain-containing protein [Luteibacter yeojuensis]NID15457.1 DUF2235 domain-containing protein [Luteibacter yeojuensis]